MVEHDLYLQGAHNVFLKNNPGTFLVVQWLRIYLSVQGTWVRSLVLVQDPTCLRAAKPTLHNYSALTLWSLGATTGVHEMQWKILHDATQPNKWTNINNYIFKNKKTVTHIHRAICHKMQYHRGLMSNRDAPEWLSARWRLEESHLQLASPWRPATSALRRSCVGVRLKSLVLASALANIGEATRAL